MRTLVCCALILAIAGAAYAELQNVEVGGIIEIRGRYHRNTWTNGGPTPIIRVPGAVLTGRSIGVGYGDGQNVRSIVDWDRKGHEWVFAESAVSLNAKADFTDNVSAMIEFYSYDVWGEDFRSNYITGADARAATNDDVEVLQAYIDVKDMFDLPLRVRIGRQVMQYGRDLNCFLVAGKTTPTQRYAFDGIRLTYYPTDDLEINAWWTKLAENSPVEEDGDVDFYGIHGAYTGFEYVNIWAYWMFVRDARAIANQGNTGYIGQWFDHLFGVDDYDPTNLHTVGLRLFGKWDALDYNLDLAYQFGEADAHGALFVPVGGVYGNDDADYGNWGMDGEIGYTFDCAWSPRVFLGGAWYEGEDNRDLTFWEWLGSQVNPFYEGKASVSFNRLFSDINYCPALQDNAWMTNFKQIRGGVAVKPTDKLWVMLRLQSVWTDEPFDLPVYFDIGKYRVPLTAAFPWWTKEADDHQGYSTCVVARYAYSQDLTFLLYWGHMFTGDGARDGSYTYFNGTSFAGGTADDDADYAFFWVIVKF